MVYSQWKQRLFAFLLRRILGPYLSTESSRKLHDSVEVSIQDGKFALNDVTLNEEYLNTISSRKFHASSTSSSLMTIRQARMQKLIIHLSLEESSHSTSSSCKGDSSNSSRSSVAWKALQLGKSSSDPSEVRVSLRAHIEIDGIEIEVEPGRETNTPQNDEQTPSEEADENTSISPAGMMSSYIDAALSSLRLSLQMKNFCLRFASLSSDSSPIQHWVEFGLASAHYHDVERCLENNVNAHEARTEASRQTVFHKAIDFAGITIHSGESPFESSNTDLSSRPESNRVIGRTEGTGQVTVHAIAHSDTASFSLGSSTGATTESVNSKETDLHRVQQDIEISLNQHFNICVDETSLIHLGSVMRSFRMDLSEKDACINAGTVGGRTGFESQPQVAKSKKHSSTLRNISGSEATDIKDIHAASGLMKQYHEERKLAEINPMRGGILLPSTAFEDVQDTEIDDDQRMTFDTFFDANDQSFFHYKSVLEESIMESRLHAGAQSDFIHTKVTLVLLGGGMKVCFPRNERTDLHGRRSYRLPDEYLLVTFGDIKLSTSMSAIKSELTMSLCHVEVEDSLLKQRSSPLLEVSNEEEIEIGTVLRFDEMSSLTVSEAPCMSLYMCKNTIHGSPKQIRVSLDLGAFDVVYRRYTVESLVGLIERFKEAGGVGGQQMAPRTPDRKEPENSKLDLVCCCPSFTLSVPIYEKADDLQSHRYEDCFSRCGYMLENVPVSPNATIGITFEDVSMNLINSSFEQGDCMEDDRATSSLLSDSSGFECVLVIIFVTYPSSIRGGTGSIMKRMDFWGFLGRVEVDPHVPVSIRLRNLSLTQNDISFQGAGAFPVVPALSACKARQEDEEKEIEDMYRSIYPSATMSELREMEIAEGLRGAHPQESMSSEADKCNSVVEIHIPDIIGDTSRLELVTLLGMIRVATMRTREFGQTQSPEKDADTQTLKSEGRPCVGVLFRCDHVCLSVHDFSASRAETLSENAGNRAHSFSLMGDDWKAHAVFDRARFKSFRVATQDIALFEVVNLVKAENIARNDSCLTVRDRCDILRGRNTRNSLSSAEPIFYRSQMFSPMSPESPALLLDIVSQTACAPFAGEHCKDRNVFFTAYNMTFRYDVDSGWFERLQRLLKIGEKAETNISGKMESGPQPNRQNGSDGGAYLTRLFVSLSDCNLDYSSSQHFSTPSRTIIRLGDVRVSSNLLYPSGDLQAYRVSVNDVSLHLSNDRSPYSNENARLTGAANVMSPRNLSSTLHSHLSPLSAPETALQELNFITIAMLDSVDVLLAIARKDQKEFHWDTTSKNEPLITASLSIGSLYLYACKDSFACLMDTINEWQLKVTGLTYKQVESLKAKSVPPSPTLRAAEHFFDTISETATEEKKLGPLLAEEHDLSRLEDMNILSKPLTGVDYEEIAAQLSNESGISNVDICPHPSLCSSQEFLLDGYDWTAVDHEGTKNGDIHPGEEHSARWYYSSAVDRTSAPHIDNQGDLSRDRLDEGGTGHSSVQSFRIYPQHIPLKPGGEAFFLGDMDAPDLAGTTVCPPVLARVMVRDCSLRCRFFDGYDWPKSAKSATQSPGKNHSFVIAARNEKSRRESTTELANETTGDPGRNHKTHRKAKLMGDLLDEEVVDDDKRKAFNGIPLPEEKGEMLEEISETRRLARRSNRFFQISILSAKLRFDSFEDSSVHQLASCMRLCIGDMFLAETLSGSNPTKMLGEWVNDMEHPRDTNDGLVMMKMASWHPEVRVSDDGKIVPLQSRAALELLPLRCRLDQRAMRFVAAFFSSEDQAEGEASNPSVDSRIDRVLWAVPPPFFTSFKVQQSKLKVDYRPEKVNVDALRDGSYVELVNLSPLNDMVITLQPVKIRNLVGFGVVVKEMLRLWIQDVSSSQMYKFLTNAAPFQPISNVGGGVADFVILPWEALKKGERVTSAVRSGALSLAGAVTFEALNTTAKLTKYAAEKLDSLSSTTNMQTFASSSMLPSRPQGAPRGVPSTTGHAVESLAHGLSAASYKVVIIPVREFHRQGAIGAAKSVVRGIPIAIMAPISGATEALSYTLLGARNQIRPDIRKEEEASLRGLKHGDF